MSSPPPLHQEIRPEWVDYNGHLSEAYYALVFGFATDALIEHVGADADYRAATGCSLYTVELHIRYLHEVRRESAVRVDTRVVGSGAKKLHLCHEMTAGDRLVATEEVMALHVDQAAGKSSPFPQEIADRISALREPPPDYAGRSVG